MYHTSFFFSYRLQVIQHYFFKTISGRLVVETAMEVWTTISMKTTNARAVVQNMDDHSMLNDHGLAVVLKSNDCTTMDDQNCPGPQLFFPSAKYHCIIDTSCSSRHKKSKSRIVSTIRHKKSTSRNSSILSIHQRSRQVDILRPFDLVDKSNTFKIRLLSKCRPL
jgi:hypothetical protein